MRDHRRISLLIVVAALASAVTVSASLADEPRRGLATTAWPLEVIEFRDGRRLEGLVVDADGETLEGDDGFLFIQVLRPPGRPMSLITWGPLDGTSVRDVRRLPADERDRLATRIAAFRERRRHGTEAEAAVSLVRDEARGVWQASTGRLAITSTAEAATTRQAAAALELIFDGLEGLVPPRTSDRPPIIDLRLCGSAAEYRDVQRSLAVSIDAPAFYVPARRLLVAGGDLDASLDAAMAVDDALELATRHELDRDARFEALVRDLAADLEAQGIPAAQRGEIVRRARQRWQREHAAEIAALADVRRDNERSAAAAREAFRRQLAHEAWHAYADTRLRDERAGLPAWLDEGLAQIVESAPLEAGELRLDAPDPTRLAALLAAFDAGTVPRLADLVRGDGTPFLSGHAGRDGTRAVAYLTAWGVALDMALVRPVLSRDRLPDLVDEADPLSAFERIVGAPIDDYEAAWRRRLRGIRGRSGPTARVNEDQ